MNLCVSLSISLAAQEYEPFKCGNGMQVVLKRHKRPSDLSVVVWRMGFLCAVLLSFYFSCIILPPRSHLAVVAATAAAAPIVFFSIIDKNRTRATLPNTHLLHIFPPLFALCCSCAARLVAHFHQNPTSNTLLCSLCMCPGETSQNIVSQPAMWEQREEKKKQMNIISLAQPSGIRRKSKCEFTACVFYPICVCSLCMCVCVCVAQPMETISCTQRQSVSTNDNNNAPESPKS